MSWNVPDDWGSYYYTCSICGSRAHSSEGDCCEACERCEEAAIDDEDTGLCNSCAEEVAEEVAEELEESNKEE
jgi:hypothetical protein